MSGFFAVFHFDRAPVDEGVVERVSERLRFRGTDGESVWRDEGVVIAVAQMKVTHTDLAEQQPRQHEDVVVAADSTLFGRDDLCHVLHAAGHDATPDMPDSLLILHAFQVWGERCVEHLMGDFAFVIWNCNRRQVFAARDQIGNRVLFYARVGSALIISNILGAVRQHPAVSVALNDLAIADFLLFFDPSWEDKSSTSYRDIVRLKPAHCLTANADRLDVHNYWTLPLDEPMLRFKTREDYVDAFRWQLRQAIRERMQTERVVLTLSGGMDSGSIAALAADLVRSGEVSAELTAFTTVYDRIHPDTEAFYARLVAQHLKLPICFFSVDSFTLRNPMEPFIEPSQNWNRGLLESAYKQQWAFGRVVLTGNGSDETLYETPLYEVLHGMHPKEALDLYRWLWRFEKKRPSMGGLGRYLRYRARLTLRGKRQPKPEPTPFPIWINQDFASTYHLRERWDAHWARKFVYQHKLHPIGYHISTTPSWEDKPEFYDSSTPPVPVIAAPFLDLRMMRFAMQLPPTPWNHQKYILRQALKGYLPPEILQRPKTPLGMLLSSLLRHTDAAWVDHWQPVDLLSRYVRRDLIPPVYNGAADPAGEYLHTRPMHLNEWLRSYTADT